MRSRIRRPIRTATLIAIVVFGVVLALKPAQAGHGNWSVDDTCSVSEVGTYFRVGGPPTTVYVHQGKGINNCHLWVATQKSEPWINFADWYLARDADHDGDYFVYAFIPCDSHSTARSARYYRYRSGTDALITETYSVNQDPLCDTSAKVTDQGDGSGYDHFYGSRGGYMRGSDRNGATGYKISWDYLAYLVRHSGSGGGC